MFNCIFIWYIVNGTSDSLLSLSLFLILVADLKKSLVTYHKCLVLHACPSELPEKLSLRFQQKEMVIYT